MLTDGRAQRARGEASHYHIARLHLVRRLHHCAGRVGGEGVSTLQHGIRRKHREFRPQPLELGFPAREIQDDGRTERGRERIHPVRGVGGPGLERRGESGREVVDALGAELVLRAERRDYARQLRVNGRAPETYDIRIDGDTLMMALPSSPDAVFGYTRQG